MSATHELKVVPPYFDALVSGSKTFEVRKNDRAYQKGDRLRLWDFNPAACSKGASKCKPGDGCPAFGAYLEFDISYVYSGDSRFGGLEPGYVVLGLGAVVDTGDKQ